MLRPDDEFRLKLEAARDVERGVAAILKASGWRILPTYDYSGGDGDKAPKLEAARARDSLVVPDLLGVKGGRCIWYEVKSKARASLTHITGRLETGIDRRHARHYAAVQRESGFPVWVVLVHRQERVLIAAALDDLRPLARVAKGMGGREGMVFFPFEHAVWRRTPLDLRHSELLGRAA